MGIDEIEEYLQVITDLYNTIGLWGTLAITACTLLLFIVFNKTKTKSNDITNSK